MMVMLAGFVSIWWFVCTWSGEMSPLGLMFIFASHVALVGLVPGVMGWWMVWRENEKGYRLLSVFWSVIALTFLISLSVTLFWLDSWALFGTFGCGLLFTARIAYLLERRYRDVKAHNSTS